MNVTITKTGRVYKRKFDWDEARRLHSLGYSYKQLAKKYDVSCTSIARVCDDHTYHRMRRTQEEWQRSGKCIECGELGRSPYQQRLRNGRCRSCATAFATKSVREHELRCYHCQQWKPDEDFPFGNYTFGHYLRRRRNGHCRLCCTIIKREWRERHPDRAREAYDRDNEHRKMKRAAK